MNDSSQNQGEGGFSIRDVTGNVDVDAAGDIVGGDKVFGNKNIYNYTPKQLRAPLKHKFNLLIERLTLMFAGRRPELARIAQFIGNGGGSYLIVTAPAGFGKSALMASLIKGRREAFAYHFFTISDPQTLTEEFFLRNVVEQLVNYFGGDGQLPSDKDSLGALMQGYMVSEPSRPVVLILDGVQEIRWDPADSTGGLRRYLCRELPKGLAVILTVRETGQDWAGDLELCKMTLQNLRLHALTVGEVREACQAAGGTGARVAADEKLFAQVMRIIAYQGDHEQAYPPLVRWVLSDIADGNLLPERLCDRSPGFDPYRAELWKSLRSIAKDDNAVEDFIGTLAAALGPLRPEELKLVNPSLATGFAGDAFEQDVLPVVRRFVFGDEERGYIFAPAPFREHVRQHLASSLRTYQDRLIEFCSNWMQHREAYALEYYPAHLAERAQAEQYRKALFELVNDEDWCRERSKRDPSHAALLGDLQLAWAVAVAADELSIRAGRPATFLGQKLRWCLTSASVRSIVLSLRSRLLAAMVETQVLTASQAVSIVINRIALVESQGGQYFQVTRAIEALAPLLLANERTRAANAFQRVSDHEARATALYALAQSVPDIDGALLNDALKSARAICDVGTRARTLARLVPGLPLEESKTAVCEAAEAARSVDTEDRAEILLAVASAAENDLELRQQLLREARASAANISEPNERAEALCALARLVETDEASAALSEARVAADAIEDPSDQIRWLSEIYSLMPQDSRLSLVEETLNKARELPHAESAERIASLVQHVANGRQNALVEETLALADEVQPDADKALVLLSIAKNLPAAYRDQALARAEGIARKMEDDVQQDRLLVEVALSSDVDAQRKLLIEVATRRPGDLGTKSFEREEREVAELFAFVASHVPPSEQRSLVADALEIARSHGIRGYDQARAFLALAPNLAPTDCVALFQEVRTLARALQKPSEKAEILVDLVLLVPPDQTNDALQEAILASRAAPTSGLEFSGTIDREEGVVTFNRTSNLWRGQLFASLARSCPSEIRSSLIQEGIQSLNEMEGKAQAATIAALARFFSESAAVNLLDRIGEVQEDPLRLEVIALVLERLARLESLDAARSEAHDIWGDNVPGPVWKVLSGDSPPPRLHATEEDPDENTSAAGSRAEDTGTAKFSISFCAIDFLNYLYRLTTSPASAIGEILFDPILEKGSAEQAKMAENVAKYCAAQKVSELAPKDIRAALEGLREFRSGELWLEARVALILRLIELGAVDEAHSHSDAFWRTEVPAQVLYSFWQASNNMSQDMLVRQILPATLKIQNSSEKVRLLGRLLPHVPDQQRARIELEMAGAASTILTDSRIEHLDEELLTFISSLPETILLDMWHQAMRKLSVGNRKQLLIALPPLLFLGAKLTSGQLWLEAALQVRTVTRRWP